MHEQLDLLVASGGNYVRNTMSSRDEGNLWPFYQQEDGIYDLARWNDAYWKRFDDFLNACQERDIIVQVELWATFDFYQEYWDVNPFNPKNNRNYDSARTRLPLSVPNHPTYRGNPFFRSVPQMDNNARLMEFQVYGNDGGRHQTTQQGTEAFIRNVFLGCASSRFHRPTSGQGLNERAQKVIRSLRDLSERMNVFEASPGNGLLENRQPEEAYCMAVPGREYAIYFPNGGSIDLDLSSVSGKVSLVWCDVLNSKWSDSEEIAISRSLKLECPGMDTGSP